MKLLKSFFIPLAAAAAGFPTSAAVLFNADFETRDFSQVDSVHKDTDATVEVVKNPAGDGWVMKSAITPEHERAEIRAHRDPVPSERWYGWSLFLPADYEEIKGKSDILFQWHRGGNLPKWANSHPMTFMINDAGFYQITHTHQTNPAKPETRVNLSGATKLDYRADRGKWVHWALHAKWSVSDDGRLTLYCNGEKAWEHKGANWLGGVAGPMVKAGIYTGNAGWKGNNPTTVYHDNLIVGDEKSGIAEVNPALAQAPGTKAVSALAEMKVAALGPLSSPLAATDETKGTPAKWAAVRALLGADAERMIVKQIATDLGGNTSVRNESPLNWKEGGYFRRARDLGQVFTAPEDFTLDALILRTGNDDLAFLPGTAGAEVCVQFFEVTGEPKIDDNGTPPGAKATHGFSTNHRCDDFITGVEYRSLRVVAGGRLPDLATKGDGKLAYMKWSFDGADTLRFEKGRRYAFMAGFAHADADRNFTLANRNHASSRKPPSLTDPEDAYPGGWGIRREGNGHNPPLMLPGAEPPADAAQLARLRAEASFPEGDARFAIPPTTEGYPDVCTYRDLEFYLLKKAE